MWVSARDKVILFVKGSNLEGERALSSERAKNTNNRTKLKSFNILEARRVCVCVCVCKKYWKILCESNRKRVKVRLHAWVSGNERERKRKSNKWEAKKDRNCGTKLTESHQLAFVNQTPTGSKAIWVCSKCLTWKKYQRDRLALPEKLNLKVYPDVEDAAIMF